jgi:integral membrane protein
LSLDLPGERPFPAGPIRDEGARVLKLFILAARLEALTWAGLLLGMALKYSPLGIEAGVWLFGRLHGGAFLFYFVVALITALLRRWPWWVGLLAVLAAVPPLVTVPLEAFLRRRGLLDHG